MPPKILKADGRLENFNPAKLKTSLLKSGAGAELAEEIIRHIEKELRQGMSTAKIFEHSRFLMEKKSKPAAARYSLRRAVLDLGPSGFPFEDFLAEIFRHKGFEVRTREFLAGRCAEHEIDLLIFNENKLAILEAKFHNSLGVKSDLKTALAVKARFDDLKNLNLNFRRARPIDESWLVTNTKFTVSAVKFGLCAGLRLVGWNYPPQDNLQDLIDDSGLHPLTCLSTLSAKQKNLLLKSGTVLCRKLIGNREAWRLLNFSAAQTAQVEKEIALVCRL